jgi:hypothetical protein
MSIRLPRLSHLQRRLTLVALSTGFLSASLSALAAEPTAPAGLGLVPRAEAPVWPRVQARVLTIPIATLPADSRLVGDPRSGLGAAPSLVGDLYFTSSLLGPRIVGGFRATSGLLLGAGLSVGEDRLSGAAPDRVNEGLLPRPAWQGGANLPYVGVGYTGMAAQGGWGFVADLGLVATNPGALRLGRSWQNSQAVDEVLRELRLTPLLRLGVSYAF